ncbi:unnamed protein product [Rotaria magnacalcarata]|uniref:Nudix hydrolase domain-containing protein n=1 Tax=Rotaria magnacalcarata TaxID=392030 RepID=A0A816RWM5_9BILA|nr:unnamed protein product [Rotaria magnacalcarata]CAF4146370.1 unnamed protein product [Rotaria magnacalcarata]
MATTSAVGELRQVKSCGFFVMRSNQSVLLMKHKNRYDLPKGHMEPGETEQQTALRELLEETGIKSSDIDIDPHFHFEQTYFPIYKRFGGEKVQKTLVIFLARLKSDSIQVVPTEHPNFEWHTCNSLQPSKETKNIDELLHKIQAYLNQ